MEWKDPRELADAYSEAVRRVSRGQVDYVIEEWKDLDAFPVKTDGFQYTPETWLHCWLNREDCHQPDGSDYPRLLQDYGASEAIDAGRVDEVWMFGAPYLGFWESAMAGPGAFYINGGVYEEVSTDRPFVVMGFSYERGLAEMLHDLSHRTESTMTRVYGGWKSDELTSNWARFAANFEQSGGVAAVGSCHYPPNAEKDYDYSNLRVVQSSAVDWLDYPELDGTTAPVSAETWGGPDYHLNYMEWWFSHLPHAPGWNADGRLNDWWEYVFHFTAYDEQGALIAPR
jgi:hypothetical protein